MADKINKWLHYIGFQLNDDGSSCVELEVQPEHNLSNYNSKNSKQETVTRKWL